jgi:hypothetical protein
LRDSQSSAPFWQRFFTSPLLNAAGGTLVPIKSHVDFATFYIGVAIAGAPMEEYLLDTGSGYMTITSRPCRTSKMQEPLHTFANSTDKWRMAA